LALAVPLSRFTSRVGGGSAFFVRPMRQLLLLCLVLIFLTGCLHRARDDSFHALHVSIVQKFAGVCNCGPIIKSNLVASNEIFFGPYFEVVPKGSPCEIIVCEYPYFSKVEWDKRFAKGTNQLNEFIASAKSGGDPEFSPFSKEWFQLPGWSYERTGVAVELRPANIYTGVDVELRPPHISPEYGDISEKDKEQAYHIYQQILGLLTPYE